MAEIVVGISGASGIILGHRLVEVLAKLQYCVHLVLSRAALYTAHEEMGPEYATAERFFESFAPELRQYILPQKIGDFGAAIASGSHLTAGMVVVPCSMATLAAIALGLSDNLLRRAADVTLKERRRLIIVPRETPLSEVHLDNMLRLTRMGGVILPPVPAWYTRPQTLHDMEDFVVGRILDLLGIEANLYPRWNVAPYPASL